MNIWDLMYEKFTFKQDTITLFEAFAGVGTFHMALNDLSNEFNFKLDVVGISEIDKYAIASYNAIHGNTNNYGSICDIKEMPQVDIFTYSFPCQDISLAGNQKGFSRDSGTRSGLLWEVERILENQEKLNKLPKVLLMENVKALVGMKFKDDYIEWQLKLESLGYKNYWEVLNSKNYGIPQNRERVFMVSILGEYSYNFPKPFPLKLRLKDILEDEVDEKFYLSDKAIAKVKRSLAGKFININDEITGTIIAGYYKIPRDAPYLELNDGRKRRYTPLETWRLMGFSNQDYKKAASVVSNTQLYKQAGNAIVKDVAYYILKELF